MTKQITNPADDHAASLSAQETAARDAAVAEICRLQFQIDGSGVALDGRTKQEVFLALETLTQHIGLKGATETAFVGLINAMRGQGIALQEICRHDQITFKFLQPIQERLPFNFDSARDLVALARKLPQEVTTIEEARQVIRSVLEEAELLKVEEGGGTEGLATDKATKFLATIQCVKQDWQKVERVAPMDKWSPARLHDFMDATLWLQETRERAKKILGEPVAPAGQ